MITVLGATGYIGSNLVKKLVDNNIEVYAPERADKIDNKDLGHVIYCIGMTADFRTKPFETVEAHVSKLSHVLQSCSFNSLTYLSSTRVYLKSITTNQCLIENDNIVINSSDAFDLFAASKITGELLALNSGRPNIKIVRLSNVFGADLFSENFITSIIRDAVKIKKVELFTTPESSKDYICIDDVCDVLIKLAPLAITDIFNLSYGTNTTNEVILNEIKNITKAEIIYSPKAQKIIFKEIDNKKIIKEIGFIPSKNIVNSLAEIINAFQNLI